MSTSEEVSESRCRVCGHAVAATAVCEHCSAPPTVRDKFPVLGTTPNPTPARATRWDAARLKLHPDLTRLIAIENNQCVICTAKDINYRGVLDEKTWLCIWCPPEGNRIFIRVHQSPDSCDAWLTIAGVVVDGGVLRPGDLLTIGSYPWVLEEYARGNGFGLQPIQRMHGASLEINDLQVGKDRLNVGHLAIEAGQFVAVIGPTGSGKSTLITELAGRRIGHGDVRINGISRESFKDPAVGYVAYVPQRDIVHHDLTIEQQALDYCGITQAEVDEPSIDNAVRTVGLRDLNKRFPEQISGGQLRRCRLAAAIARHPAVLVLDEPDSGLDPETASGIRRLLRTFSLLGVTVITITHHLHDMSLFDREIELDDGRIVSDSMPIETVSAASVSTPSFPSFWQQLRRLLTRETVAFSHRSYAVTNPESESDQPPRRMAGLVRQLRRIGSQSVYTLVWLPLLFAVAIAIAVPQLSPGEDQLRPYLVGFLSVLSVIWIAASGSHLTITEQYERIQFERLQGLRPYAYLLSKTIFFSGLAVMQATVLTGVLVTVRHHLMHQPVFYGTSKVAAGDGIVALGTLFVENLDVSLYWVWVVLVVVALTATQIGLLISAMARGHSRIAAGIIPLVMMTQLLFSPFVVQAKVSDGSVQKTYEGFWLRRQCDGVEECPSHLVAYYGDGRYLCPACADAIEFDEPLELEGKGREMREADNQKVPSYLATILSEATMTRHADIALRPVIGLVPEQTDDAKHQGDPEHLTDTEHQYGPQAKVEARQYGHRWTSWSGLLGLACLATLSHLFTVVIYCRRELLAGLRRRTFHLTRSRNSAVLIVTLSALMFPAISHSQEGVSTIQLTLAIEDGQYDVSGLSNSRATSPHATSPVWFPLTAKTKSALWLLKSIGTLRDYSITDSEIVLEFDRHHERDLQTALFPPRLQNLTDYAGEDQVVVLVHGLEGGLLTYRELTPVFRDAGWFVMEMVYPNDGGVQRPADYLREELNRFAREHPHVRIAVVAHSLGGLVAWAALSNDAPQSVSDLVTLGTPYLGSAMASFQQELEFADIAVRLLGNDRESLDMVSDGSGEATIFLRPNSPEREELLSHPLPKHIGLQVVAGSDGPIAMSERAKLTAGIEGWIEHHNPASSMVENLRSLADADELIAGVGDGAVTVVSATGVPAAESKRVFELSHTGLLQVRTHPELFEWIHSAIDP